MGEEVHDYGRSRFERSTGMVSLKAQKKNAPIMVLVEPTLKDMVEVRAREEGGTMSAYLRKLIIRDLQSRGKLSSDDLLGITGNG